jgi:hypothetical protein
MGRSCGVDNCRQTVYGFVSSVGRKDGLEQALIFGLYLGGADFDCWQTRDWRIRQEFRVWASG